MFLILSASLHPESRSRILATTCRDRLQAMGRECSVFDLAEQPLPPCDGHSAYSHPHVQMLDRKIRESQAVLIASPVYNYDVNAAAKNAVELTGRAWTGKVIGLMLAAGGQGSYMSGMGLANSLMLDFRCLVVPRFLYAIGPAFSDGRVVDEKILERLDQLVHETVRISDALAVSVP